MEEFRTLAPCCMLSPVPAVMVSCRGVQPGDKPNIVTIAWAGTVNSNPPMVSISVQKKRFSYEMILVDEAHCKALDYCGVKSGRDVDKWAETGLTPMAAQGMQYAPAIAECPAYLSCKVRQVLSLGSHEMFLGEVVGVSVQEKYFAPDGSLHLEAAHLVGYSHGVYQRCGEVLGFFGYSVANPDVLEKRMAGYWK